MNQKSMMLIGQEADGVWRARFGDFAEEEALMIAESVDQLFDQCKIPQLELTAWNPSIEAVVGHLYSKGFIFAEGQDDEGKVVQRTVYKKRGAEARF